MSLNIRIVDYLPHHQPWFEKFNRAWIEQYFWMESIDFDVLQQPDQFILGKGGYILMAEVDGEVVGTVALKWVMPGVYEFTKMAVDEKFHGKRAGLALAEAAIQKATELKAYKIILYSNTILKAAIALYEKLGFREIPVDGPYKRSNIKMELLLPAAPRIRRAGSEDANTLRELGIRTFHDTFAANNTAEDMKSYLDQSFAPGQVESELAAADTIFWMAYVDEQLAGYAKVRESGIPEGLVAKRPLEIERIYALQAFHGQSVGKALMETCLQHARLNDYDVIWLGVWEHNPRAIAFYEKYGFEKFGSHPFLLGSDLQTDYLMKKNLTD